MSEYLKLPSQWSEFLPAWQDSQANHQLAAFLKDAYQNTTIYPKADDLFKALELTAPDTVKIVILGQDPYHTPHRAHGLAFSIYGDTLQPSLKNIYQELSTDLKIKLPAWLPGDLTSWANQGVLLLNTVLSVEKGLAGSHRKLGWEVLTDMIIKNLSADKAGVVFILWGNDAIKKEKMIDDKKHLILKSVHPSPLSAYRGFFGSRPFSKANAYLITKQKDPIIWNTIFQTS